MSCDWGTTSFRLKLADSATGQMICHITDSAGIKKIYQNWQQQSDKKERVDLYLDFLAVKISELQHETDILLEGLPVILSGMASSSIGFKELPYASLPLDLDNPSLVFSTIEKTRQFEHELIIVSGLRCPDDVLRGEETQLLGVLNRESMVSGVYVFPGTHSKHLFIDGHILTHFKTYLTGELFDILCSQSILSNSITTPQTSKLSGAFKSGVHKSSGHNLLHSLFEIRANDLLCEMDKEENYLFLSGMLIGTELQVLQPEPPENIILVGEQPLRSFYAACCRILNLDYHEIDSSDLTLFGHHYIFNHILNQN